MLDKPAKPGKPKVWMLMASGKTVDLMNLTPADVHWPDLVECLVKLPRFNGATAHVTYTVAQHCCLAYDLAELRYKKIALLNDFYKGYLGELTRSGAHYLAHLSDDPKLFKDVMRLAKDELSRPIFDAAGVNAPDGPEAFCKEQDYLRWLDDCLLATEKRDLMAEEPGAPDWHLPEPMPMPIKAWHQDKAREEILKRLSAIGIDGRV